jgi:hypothetical protein
VIAGNPKIGRRLAAFAIALFVVMCLVTAWLGLRKRTDPQPEPPLLPSTFVIYL